MLAARMFGKVPPKMCRFCVVIHLQTVDPHILSTKDDYDDESIQQSIRYTVITLYTINNMQCLIDQTIGYLVLSKFSDKSN